MNIEKINNATAEQAHRMFLQCCTSERWIESMVASRPYASVEALYWLADKYWRKLEEADYLQAFEGHPKIGDVNSLKEKYRHTKVLAAGEQSAVDGASDEVIHSLADGNRAYEERFGFIFIICATGKSAEQMLALLEARLPNNRDTELRNAAEEQRKIFHIRLNKLLGE